MIESRFWKERLRRIAWQIRRVSKPPRWTERAHCTVEMDLMIGFFMVRRLIELHKVSSRVRDFAMGIYSSPNAGVDVTSLFSVKGGVGASNPTPVVEGNRGSAPAAVAPAAGAGGTFAER